MAAAKTTSKEPQLSSETKEIWKQIKDLPISFFGLKNIKVKDTVTPLNIDRFKLFLDLKAPAVLPALEESLSELTVKSQFGELVTKFVVESVKGRAVVSLHEDLKSLYDGLEEEDLKKEDVS